MIPVPVLTPRLSQPLARARDAALRAGGPQAHREHLPRDHGATTTARAATSAIATAGPARGDRAARSRNEDREFARDALVRRALRGAGEPRAVGATARCSASRLVDSRRCAVAVPPARAFAPIRAHRRRHRLVRARLAVAAARRDRPARRRRRRAARAARSRSAAGRRHRRLVARRGVRARPPAAAARGDEGAGPRLARVRGDADGGGQPSSGRRRSSSRSGCSGSSLLVRDLCRCTAQCSAACWRALRAPRSAREAARARGRLARAGAARSAAGPGEALADFPPVSSAHRLDLLGVPPSEGVENACESRRQCRLTLRCDASCPGRPGK